MKLADPKAPKITKVEKKVLPQLDTLEDEVEFHTEDTVIISDPMAINDIQDPDIFYFTNSSYEPWSTQWNKIKYTFPARKTVRLYIKGESPENVQSIRKMFAFRYAQDQFLKTDTVNNLIIQGKGSGATYDEKLLQPYIDQCLKPLEKDKLNVTEVKDNPDAVFKASKAVSDGADLILTFKDDSKSVVGM